MPLWTVSDCVAGGPDFAGADASPAAQAYRGSGLALCLDLALREQVALASRDGPLLEAARRRGVETHDLR